MIWRRGIVCFNFIDISFLHHWKLIFNDDFRLSQLTKLPIIIDGFNRKRFSITMMQMWLMKCMFDLLGDLAEMIIKMRVITCRMYRWWHAKLQIIVESNLIENSCLLQFLNQSLAIDVWNNFSFFVYLSVSDAVIAMFFFPTLLFALIFHLKSRLRAHRYESNKLTTVSAIESSLIFL